MYGGLDGARVRGSTEVEGGDSRTRERPSPDYLPAGARPNVGARGGLPSGTIPPPPTPAAMMRTSTHRPETRRNAHRLPVALVAGAALAAGALFAAAAPAPAQQLPGAGAEALPRAVRVYPRIGLIDPDRYFYEYFLNFAGDGQTEWTTGSLGRALVAGAGVEVRLGSGAAYLRGEVLRSFDGWLSAAHSWETLRDLFTPPEIRTVWFDLPATVTLTSLQLVLPTRLELGPVKPYVLVGAGGKHYAFGEPTMANEVDATFPADGFTWGGDVGAGLTARVLGLTIDVQARDAWSRYWGKYQHDMMYTGTVSLGLF